MRQFITVFAVLLCGQAALCNLSVEPGLGIANYITNGEPAPVAAFPWQALLSTSPPSGFGSALCGGSLISPQWVLTAAHCFKGKQDNPGTAKVVLGANNKNRAEATQQSFKSIKVIQHSAWTGNIRAGSHDIALIKLDRPATLNKYVDIVRLPSSDSSTWEKHTGYMSGWGEIKDGMGAASVLQYTYGPIINNAVCTLEYSPYSVSDSNICVSGINKKAICSGDSGGPLVVYERDNKPTLVGITSFSHASSCESGKSSVFTRVSKFLPWIRANML